MKRCEELVDALPDVTVDCGDGTDRQLLDEEHLENMDGFVACTGIDEVNAILSLYVMNRVKKKVVTNFEAKPIQQQIFKDGKCVYKKPAYEDIVKYAASEIDTLWDEITRFENPHTYYVDLSQKLWEVKNYLLAENNRQTAD